MGISKLKFKIFLAVLPPEPPPGLCPGSAGGLTAPPPPHPKLGWTSIQHVIKAFGLKIYLQFGLKISENTPDSKKIWEGIRSIVSATNKKSIQKINFKIDNEIITDDKVICYHFNKFFSSIVGK